MTKKELIEQLADAPDDMRIMMLDGFNTGGRPRTINWGPHDHKITYEEATRCGDCEGMEGQTVWVIGCGFY